MATKKTSELVGDIVDLLTPLDSIERQRVIQASLTLLGETFSAVSHAGGDGSGGLMEADGDGASSMPPRARAWIKQNGVSLEGLQQIFHLENGGADVIAGEIPGKNKKEQTLNAYVLVGLSKLLSVGNPDFDDKTARSLCESLGCYDSGNHSKTISERGNLFTGFKDKGWTLTAPGLKNAAALVKEMTKS